MGEAQRLPAILGYPSERRLLGQSGHPADFVGRFARPNPGVQAEREFLRQVCSIGLLFQFGEEELRGGGVRSVSSLAGGGGGVFPQSLHRSFLFFVTNGWAFRPCCSAALLPTCFPWPSAIAAPRKQFPERDVPGHVALIREIQPQKPHRAHLDILQALSLAQRLAWMNDHNKPHNLDGLLAAWPAALDTEALNKQFYGELFGWFERARKRNRPSNASSA